jgi:hypothetical protein
MKDEEAKLEEIEVSHTLGGSVEILQPCHIHSITSVSRT